MILQHRNYQERELPQIGVHTTDGNAIIVYLQDNRTIENIHQHETLLQ